MAKKQFTITTAPVVVPASVNPLEYRIDFDGPAPVDSVHMAGVSVPAVVDFTTDGIYIATAGLYDGGGELIGFTSIASFSVSTPVEVKEVQAVGSLTISDV